MNRFFIGVMIAPVFLLAACAAGASTTNLLPQEKPVTTGKNDSSPSFDPVNELGRLTMATTETSDECMAATQALSDTPFSATESEQNAGVVVTTQACATVGQFVRAIFEYPGSWGMYRQDLDGSFLLSAVQAACSIAEDSPMCIDAALHDLL